MRKNVADKGAAADLFHYDDKFWYSIGETSKMLEIPTSTLRFWEKEFDVLNPGKSKKGTRYYSKNDISILKTIKYLTKTQGYTLQGAKAAMKQNFIKEAENAEIADTLFRAKEFLLKLKDLL